MSAASTTHNTSIAILDFVTSIYTVAARLQFRTGGRGAARPVSAGSVPAGRGQDDVKPLLTFVNNIARNYYAL
jgi:hypothetical protein